jgi:hypothetical protein
MCNQFYLPSRLKRSMCETFLKTWPVQQPASRGTAAAQQLYKAASPPMHSHFRRNTTKPHDQYQGNQILSVRRPGWKRAQTYRKPRVLLIAVYPPDIIFVFAGAGICRFQNVGSFLLQMTHHQNTQARQGKTTRNSALIVSEMTNSESARPNKCSYRWV